MDYLKNHCWCWKSHWDNSNYDCQVVVSISSYEEHDKEDWESIMTTKKVFDEEGWESQKEFFIDSNLPTDALKKDVFMRDYPYPKQEVLDWLTENVPDRNGKKGWCIGSDEYIAGDSCSGFTFFFQIRSDAMKFIKTWSKWKKPVIYTQYFTDVRRKLNLETLKYENL